MLRMLKALSSSQSESTTSDSSKKTFFRDEVPGMQIDLLHSLVQHSQVRARLRGQYIEDHS